MNEGLQDKFVSYRKTQVGAGLSIYYLRSTNQFHLFDGLLSRHELGTKKSQRCRWKEEHD